MRFYGPSAPFFDPSPPFSTGTSATSTLVPDTFHVAINGRPYMVDFNQPFYRQYRRQLAPLIRTQADTSTEPGDHSMDPNGLWRRSFEDWQLGAGQRYLDRPAPDPQSFGSYPNSFWQSKGIDALTNRWEISLLPDTQSVYASAHTNLAVVVAGAYIYIIDNQSIKFASSIGGSWTTVTGTPSVVASSICTDGYNVWVAYGASGVYATYQGHASASQYVSSAIDAASIVSYVNGRLMLADADVIYNIVGSGALPSPLFTAGNPTFVYSNFATGTGAIYVGATSGSQSWIYGMTVTSDGVALGAPVIQGALPAGETVTSLFGYLGFLIVGTNLGVRMCTTSVAGGVTLGSLISGQVSADSVGYGPTSPVQAIAGWDSFVWFGWSAYDAVSSGLGKLNLEAQVITDILPAFCSDLMVTSQDPVTSIAGYSGKMLFAVAGLGLFAPTANLVASGYIDSGYVMYDLTDNKVACLLDVQTARTTVGAPGYGSYMVWLSSNASDFVPYATVPQPAGSWTANLGPTVGQRFEVRLVLSADTNTATAGPVISRWTLRSYPAPSRPLNWQIPLLLNESLINASSSTNAMDPFAELQLLESYANLGRVVTFQEGETSYPVFVQDLTFYPDYTEETFVNKYFNGIALIVLEGLPSVVYQENY